MKILTKSDYDAIEGGVVLVTQPSWCIPCRRLEPEWAEVEAMLDGTDIATYTVNIDDAVKNGTADWIVQDLGIRSVPTMYVLDSMGEVNYIKARKAQEILDEVLEVLDNDPDA